MARFWHGLNRDIANILELQHYVEMEDMLHMAIKVERQVKTKAKSAMPGSKWSSPLKSGSQPLSRGRDVPKESKPQTNGP